MEYTFALQPGLHGQRRRSARLRDLTVKCQRSEWVLRFDRFSICSAVRRHESVFKFDDAFVWNQLEHASIRQQFEHASVWQLQRSSVWQ